MTPNTQADTRRTGVHGVQIHHETGNAVTGHISVLGHLRVGRAAEGEHGVVVEPTRPVVVAVSVTKDNSGSGIGVVYR